jgi:hypothetical protein
MNQSKLSKGLLHQFKKKIAPLLNISQKKGVIRHIIIISIKGALKEEAINLIKLTVLAHRQLRTITVSILQSIIDVTQTVKAKDVTMSRELKYTKKNNSRHQKTSIKMKNQKISEKDFRRFAIAQKMINRKRYCVTRQNKQIK